MKYKQSLNYALNEQGNVKVPIEEGLGSGGREKNDYVEGFSAPVWT